MFTPQEINLIILALDRLFLPGTATGPLNEVEQIIIIARAIQAKLKQMENMGQAEIKKPPEGG
jgi:hypothetical protein